MPAEPDPITVRNARQTSKYLLDILLETRAAARTVAATLISPYL